MVKIGRKKRSRKEGEIIRGKRRRKAGKRRAEKASGVTNKRDKDRERDFKKGIAVLSEKKRRGQWTYSVYPTVLVFASAVMTMRLSGETSVSSSKMSTIDEKMVRAETQTHRTSLSSSLLSRSLLATTMIRRELSTLRHDAHTHHTHGEIYTHRAERP